MRSENKFFGFLGLAAKAGKCVYGAEATEKGVKSGRVLLVIADAGLSERSMKDVGCMCDYYGVPLITAEKDRAGAACGKNSIKQIGVTDKGFSDRLTELSKTAEV